MVSIFVNDIKSNFEEEEKISEYRRIMGATDYLYSVMQTNNEAAEPIKKTIQLSPYECNMVMEPPSSMRDELVLIFEMNKSNRITKCSII